MNTKNIIQLKKIKKIDNIKQQFEFIPKIDYKQILSQYLILIIVLWFFILFMNNKPLFKYNYSLNINYMKILNGGNKTTTCSKYTDFKRNYKFIL